MNEQTFIPSRIPMDVTQLYLDGNVLPSLDSHSFIGRKNLKALFLNGSHVEVIQNRTFHGLKALSVLHLESNFIERLEGFEFDDLDGLEELYLHQNSISFISNETFAPMASLRVVTLHGNNLVDLAIWQVLNHRLMSSRLREVTLRGNEWSCECQFSTQLKDWLIENRAKVIDSTQVHCVDQVSTSSSLSSSPRAGSGSALVPLSSGSSGQTLSSSKKQSELIVVRLLDQRNHRCLQSTDLSIRDLSTTSSSEEEEWSAVFLPLIVCTVVLLLLVALASILCYYWRKALRVWFYSNCGLRLEGSCREPAESDRLFDAFISYSSKDEVRIFPNNTKYIKTQGETIVIRLYYYF